MDLNALRRYMEFAREMGMGASDPGTDPRYRSMNNDTIRNSQYSWAQKMAEQDAARPRQPDAYDMEQQGNAQANALRAMTQALPQQAAAPAQQQQEQYDEDGFPVGRNYGRQMQANALRSMQDWIAMNNQAENGAAQRSLLGAQTQRLQRPMPTNLYPDRPMPQMPQRQTNPMIENYLARLMGGR